MTSPSPSRSSASPSVSVSPSRSTSPSPSGSQPAGTCKVAYSVAGQWPGGFQGDVKVTNTGTTAVNGWQLTWTYANGQVLTQSWGAKYAQSGAAVTMTNESYGEHPRRRHRDVRVPVQLERHEHRAGRVHAQRDPLHMT